jgi:hypothetical protein
MAKKTGERLKRTALLGFVAVCVGLIGLIWAEGLRNDAPATPSYYRDTFRMDDSIYLTVTAEAIEQQRNLANGTPAPEDHNGSGSGQGQGRDQNSNPTATPNATPSAGSTPQPGG